MSTSSAPKHSSPCPGPFANAFSGREPRSGCNDATFAGRSPRRSVDSLPRKPLSTTPELANGTPFSFVINPFLVWAADDAVRHDDRQDVMALYEVQDLLQDGWIGPHVAVLHFPVPHLARLS